MQFFTRDLYNRLQTQDEPLWAKVKAEWDDATVRCNSLFNSLRESLPQAVQEFFSKYSLHDARVDSVKRIGPDGVSMQFNTRGAPWVPGTRCSLDFSAVRMARGVDGLIGQWWLYHEFHPSEPCSFDLRVLCDKSEFRIIADSLEIEWG